MKFRIILLTALFSTPLAVVGQNLVPNASFEEYELCVDDYGAIETATGWFKQSGSSDYFNACCRKKDFVSIPSNFMGYQEPLSGRAYAGFYLFHLDRRFERNGYLNREYLHSELMVPLEAGEIYNVTFYFSLADSSEFYTDHFSLCFSKSKHLEVAKELQDILKCDCIVKKVLDDTHLSDTQNWQKFEVTYTATGGEKFLVLGFFNNFSYREYKILTRSSRIRNLKNWRGNNCYYYIDDVSVVKVKSKTEFAK